MTYFLIFITSLTISIVANIKKSYVNYQDEYFLKIRPNKVILVLLVVWLILIIGFRGNINDTEAYLFFYKTQNNSFYEIFNSKGFGFGLLRYLLNFISNDGYFFLLSCAFITIVLYFITFYRYCEVFPFSLFLFFVSGPFYMTMAATRQCIAASITFFGLKYLINGNWLKYTILVIIASTFHDSAIIMLPIFFIIRSKLSKFLQYTIVFIFFFFVYFSSILLPSLFSLVNQTRYGDQYYDMIVSSDIRVNILRVFVALVPFLLGLISRKQLIKKKKYIDIILYLSLFNFLFMFAALIHPVISRFTTYFDLYNIILIPLSIKYFFNKDIRILIYIICVLLYSTYFYYDQFVAHNNDYYSPILSQLLSH